MGRSHSHAATAGYAPSSRRRLAIAFAITGSYCVAEVVGGYLANSLALLSDAAHMITDVFSLGMALLAAMLAAQPATKRRSFGLYRVEVLVALANGLLLLVVVGKIVWEAIERFRDPPQIQVGLLLAVASLGLLVNVVSAWVLAGGRHTNLNVRAAFLHIVGDLLGSVAVIVGGVVMLATGNTQADAIISFVVAALVLVSALRLIRDAGHVLLEGAPVDTDEVATALCELPVVESVHDVHAWSLTPGLVALTAHVVVAQNGPPNTDALLDQWEELLRQRFGIEHATFQIERSDRCTSDEVGSGCALEASNLPRTEEAAP